MSLDVGIDIGLQPVHIAQRIDVGTIHAQRGEDVLLHEILEMLTRDALDDASQQHIVHIGVMEGDIGLVVRIGTVFGVKLDDVFVVDGHATIGPALVGQGLVSRQAGTVVPLTLSANVYPNATYTWEPANLIVNNIPGEPWKVVVETETIGETTFSVTINNNGCEESGDMAVNTLTPISITSVNASQDIICEDGQITLSATATGGSGQYSYSWEPSGWISGNSHAQTITTKKLKNDITFTCVVTDSNFPNSVNGSAQKTKNITIHNKPTVDSQLVGKDLVIPGIGYMPYVYSYNVNDASLTGYDIEHATYTWEIVSYYDTPNHIPGTLEESSWIVVPDQDDNQKAYVYVDNYGNSLLKCTIATACGSVVTEKFIYTEGYNQGESVDEINYEKLINIFPNPSNGELYIGCSEIISQRITISIYSYNGMLVDQFYGNTDNEMTHYSMNRLANGLYLIKISGDDFVVTKKFVLNK